MYEWQDVKDYVREFAPHLKGTQDFGDSLPGVFEVIIRDPEEAKNAYRTFNSSVHQLLLNNFQVI